MDEFSTAGLRDSSNPLGEDLQLRAQSSFERGLAGNPPRSERDELRHNAGREMAADGDYSMVTVTSQTELYRLKAVKALDELQPANASRIHAAKILRDFIIKTGNEDVAFSYDRAVERLRAGECSP